MMIILLVLAVIAVVGVTALLTLLVTAPMGWEDERGFHYGVQPGTDPRVSFDRLAVYDEEPSR